jgi:hypothetical protein
VNLVNLVNSFMSRNLIKFNRYREQNEQAARIILADIAKYGGESALVVVWARRIGWHPKVARRGGLRSTSAERLPSRQKCSTSAERLPSRQKFRRSGPAK